MGVMVRAEERMQKWCTRAGGTAGSARDGCTASGEIEAGEEATGHSRVPDKALSGEADEIEGDSEKTGGDAGKPRTRRERSRGVCTGPGGICFDQQIR
ncbi:unnamed protein product, partial [Mesorhabditis belari]|uniref:Uncharacterized protein n=1 Tax=Mesorhabditis belari TaxID=2138241 RepID=A0AAF3E9I5_9BILA